MTPISRKYSFRKTEAGLIPTSPRSLSDLKDQSLYQSAAKLAQDIQQQGQELDTFIRSLDEKPQDTNHDFPGHVTIQDVDFQGLRLSNAGTVAATVGIAEPGARLEVVYLREGREGRGTVVVEPVSDRPVVRGADAVMARGASVRAVSDGLQVFAVEGGSPAAAAGLQAGDLIRLVDDSAVAGLDALAAALDGTGQRILSVMRAGEPAEVILP